MIAHIRKLNKGTSTRIISYHYTSTLHIYVGKNKNWLSSPVTYMSKIGVVGRPIISEEKAIYL